MTKTLKTMTLSATLAAMFLSAGAFAGVTRPASLGLQKNVTVIYKNSAWPIKKSESCNAVHCIDI
jgi:hypothetical protein